MLHTLQNEKIIVDIDSLGGELMSIRTKADNGEYLWQGNPEYWANRAFHLFPICGRLVEGKYTYQGVTYDMQIHGFLRDTELTVEEKSDTAITFSMVDSAETRAQYPFGFKVYVSYRLDGTTIHVDFKVENTDNKDLIFTLGGHPGFCVPLEEGLTFDDYVVEFANPCKPNELEFSPALLITGETHPFALEDDIRLHLSHDLFSFDAIFLQDMDSSVTLKSSKGTKSVTVACKDAKYLGLWHKPQSDAPYICLEPWLGIPAYDGKTDDLETKRDMVHLASGKTFETGFSITIQ
ncbi:MAG: aldose 1-epimerase family protein [Clostridia bacterium]|nr:aldose 1-epimerase family protein [Clostridia bacterium]